MPSVPSQLRVAIDEIRTSDAVVVVGAGMSFLAGMPLAGQLSPLVWHTLDYHPAVKRATCDVLGVRSGCAKDAIGDEWSRIQVAFSQIATNTAARRTFQTSFVLLDRERSSVPSSAHTALARLVHSSRVPHVISLNWDTLLEAAFRTSYGIDINSHGRRLWKPHGDCHCPDEDWILPHEFGSIPDELASRMTALANQRPRTLLIAGYSERDDLVVERLIRPLTARWRVLRISPSASGEGAIRLSAGEALRNLAEQLCPSPEFPGWHYVTFEKQRGLEAAVSGERLGPRDVDACPRLPHFESAARSLELLHSVEIAGPPGCGKSITAWQLAREHHRQGWEVIRAEPTEADDAITQILALSHSYWKRVLVIDDTQILPAGFADRLAELADPGIKVIRATTDPQGEVSRAIRIPAQVAVSTLASDFRRRQQEVLPIVRRYDPQVGDWYLDVPLERRINEAEESHTPWQFAFVLRGGWRQAREELNILRDFERADLLLISVAARQLLSLDAGCTFEEVVKDSRLLGRTDDWAAKGVERIRSRAAVLPGDRLRCLHIRSAAFIIRNFLANRTDTEFASVVSLLRVLMVEREPPLRGVSWLLHEILYSDAFTAAGGTKWAFLLPEHTEKLLARCFSAATSIERRDAVYVLGTLIDHQVIQPKALIAYLDVLTRWLETANATTALAIGSLVNSLRNTDKLLAKQLVESVEPTSIADLLAEAQCADSYSWGHLLGRLWGATGNEWRAGLREALPRNHLLDLAESFKPTEISQLNELLEGLASYDSDLAVVCLHRALQTVQQAFRDDPLEALAETREIRWFLLGHDPFGRRRPSRAQRKMSKQITGALQPQQVAAGLLSCRYGDWEPYSQLLDWARQVNPAKHRQIVGAVDWKGLEIRASDLWQNPRREFRLLIYSLMVDQHGSPVREWLARHTDQMNEMDPITAGVSPEAAVEVARKGGRVNLAGHNQSDWELQAWALTRIAEVSKAVALSAIETDRPRIVAHLAKLEPTDCKALPGFLRVLNKFDADLLAGLFRDIDPGTAAGNWPQRLQEDRSEVRRGARQFLRIARDRATGELKTLAERILAGAKKPRRSSGASGGQP